MSQKTGIQTEKRRGRRWNALRCFLATSVMIRRNYAPNFNSAHPQGVYSDSLESSRSVREVEVVEMLALCAFFERTVSAINLYVF